MVNHFFQPNRFKWGYRTYIVDFGVTFAFFLISLIFYVAPPPGTFKVMVLIDIISVFEFRLDDPEISYSHKKSTVPNWAAQILVRA
jgi:hypothetical protein